MSINSVIARARHVAGELGAGKYFRITAVLLVTGGGAHFAYGYWLEAQRHIHTDNAYVNANQVAVSVQVPGSVMQLHVKNNQTVRAGEPLFDLDRAPFEMAVAKAEAELELARQSVQQTQAAVELAAAQVAQRQAELRNIEAQYRRNLDLTARNFLSRQAVDNSATSVATAQAAVVAAQANLAQAQSLVGESGNRNARIRVAEATLAQARLDLGRAHVVASTGGMIANLTLRPGNAVQPRVPLFALIDDKEYWVDANFKETELAKIRPGCKARIVLDSYPEHPFEGVVESLSAGSGTAFSLLPAQNATGNWVKVTQRVPVRIHIVATDPNYPLRIGTTASVTVDTAG